MDKANEFRERARDCRRSAATATGIEKDQWLRVAEQWEKLAERAEQFPDAFE
jgi:hypothetical protein